jgi:hypothetical protein
MFDGLQKKPVQFDTLHGFRERLSARHASGSKTLYSYEDGGFAADVEADKAPGNRQIEVNNSWNLYWNLSESHDFVHREKMTSLISK